MLLTLLGNERFATFISFALAEEDTDDVAMRPDAEDTDMAVDIETPRLDAGSALGIEMAIPP